MIRKQVSEIEKAKRLASLYNMVPNLIWSLVSLVPIVVFCYAQLSLNLLILFVGTSLLPAFLSIAMLDNLQLAKSTKSYKKLGVGLVQRLSQNGVVINYLIKKKYPAYQVIRRDAKSIKALFVQTYVFEKFHLILFVFFCLAGIYAFSKGFTFWGAVIFFLNVFYNVYPILLQQFIRIKLSSYIRKDEILHSTTTNRFSKRRLKCVG